MGKIMDGSQQPNLAQLLLAGRPAVQEHIERSDLTQRGIFVKQAVTIARVQFLTYVFGLAWVLLFPLGIYMVVSYALIQPAEDWRFWSFVVVCAAIVLGFLFGMASREPRTLLINRLKSEISQDSVQELITVVRDMIENQAAQPKPADPGPVLVPVAQPARAAKPAMPPHERVVEARALYAFVQDAKTHGLARKNRTCSFDDWHKFTHQLAQVNWIAKNGAGYNWVKSPDYIMAKLAPVCQFTNGDEWQPEEHEGLY